jgi:hypothetical protein
MEVVKALGEFIRSDAITHTLTGLFEPYYLIVALWGGAVRMITRSNEKSHNYKSKKTLHKNLSYPPSDNKYMKLFLSLQHKKTIFHLWLKIIDNVNDL